MIEVRNLTRRFRRGSETVTALDDVSLDIIPGELTVAAGPSGSGKTTLLSIIAGYERADAGTATTANGEPTGQLGWVDLGFVPQSLTLLDELTIAENVDLPDRLNPGTRGGSGQSGSAGLAPDGDPDRPPVVQLMEQLEIGHLADRLPSQVSGGEQQRAAIGRALRLAPAILIGDEPTGHQDRGRVDLVLNILRQHAYAGHVVLISSHDEAVISIADRVITLADGRLVADERSRAGTVPGR
ncbi:ABC transporter ATP-binding protein [Rugosimonospora africana]|uniref:ABC transporter ATP-binding protein n=1 Tax=Rugosimonospora africana TaxID=556532 RepID=A0A8J3QMY0_9ACTN|nr:ATP-binding cassette domain-containing protein [Rugosimonospora africana]GIH12874.1 ABC transporter ATP-binding protein [Rugosimonospora africana]